MMNNKEPKPIYLLFDCNRWKEKPMAVRCVALSPTKLVRAVTRALHSQTMEYGEGRSITAQIREFRMDWKELRLRDINDKLRFGFIDTVINGEDIY